MTIEQQFKNKKAYVKGIYLGKLDYYDDTFLYFKRKEGDQEVTFALSKTNPNVWIKLV